MARTMGEKLPIQMAALPFTDADLVGPQDRPKPDWTATMYGWQLGLNATVKSWLAEGAPNGILRAVHAASKTNEGVIYLKACDPEAEKHHVVSLSADHRTGSVSLYTPLLPFNFKKAGDDQKVVFQCQPIEVGEVKIVAVKVTGYKVASVDKETREQAEEQAKATAAGQLAAAEQVEEENA
jgi:hypothetical protein